MSERAFDRLTGCESLESSERKERLSRLRAERVVYYRTVTVTLDDGTMVEAEVEDAAFDARPWEVDRYVVFPPDLPRERYREARDKALEKAREALAAEQAALEREQEDARSIAWLKQRGRLVQRGDAWVLADCPRGEG